jgi:hypothetical protein
VLSSVSQGWPAILSNLKTLLETGQTLPMPDDADPEASGQDAEGAARAAANA